MKSFKTKLFKSGAKLTFLIALAIIVVILLNIAVSLIPTNFTHIDTTKERLFTMSEQTKTILNDLESEITIYHLCANAIEDENIAELLKRYAAITDKITITVKDTSLYPNFAAEYTDLTMSDNSLIVESDKRYTALDYYEIYTASSEEYAYYGYYDVFDGESQLTSAIDYVTSDNLPKVYYLEGHGEAELSTELINAINQQNIETSQLNLSGLEAIPDDADCIILNAPSRDISEQDKSMLISYMQSNGRLLITSDYSTNEMPIYDSLLDYYGMQIKDGIIFEGDNGSYVPKYPYFIYPTVSSHEISDPIINEKLNLLFPLAQGIVKTEVKRDSVAATDILTTSDSAYSKIDINSKDQSKTAEDIEGPFSLACAIEDENSKLIVFSTSQFLDSNINSTVAGANYDLFLNSLGWLCEKENSITIHAKNLYSTSVTVPDNASRIVFVLIVILIPFSFIAAAVTITKIRKRR